MPGLRRGAPDCSIRCSRIKCSKCVGKGTLVRRCIACDTWLPLLHFDKASLERWVKNRNQDRIVCLDCSAKGKQKQETGPRPEATLYCAGCEGDVAMRFFDGKHVKDARAKDQVWSVRCIRCTPALQQSSDSSRLYSCNGACGKDLPLEAFSVVTRKGRGQSLKTWRCELCQRPPCIDCGARPHKPIGSKALPPSEYRCAECTFPPCISCGGKRPCANWKYKIQHCPEWTCPLCKAGKHDKQK